MDTKVKLLLLKLVKFILIFFLIDFCGGWIAKQLYFNQKTGKQARITNTIQKASQEIFIFGSSHTVRHYVPEIIENKMGKTCYNAGVRGQGVLFTNMLQKLVLKRHNPEIIILNIDYNWLNENNKFYDRLGDLNPYYWNNREVIKPALGLKSEYVDFKLLFKAYQVNSTLAHVLKYALDPQKDYNGYLPEVAKFKHKTKMISSNHKKYSKPPILPLDTHFVDAYKSLIQSAKEKNIALYLVISPSLQHINLAQNKSLSQLKEIAENEKIPVFNLLKDKRFINQPELFRDESHLNAEGAQVFSTIISKYIEKTHMRNASD